MTVPASFSNLDVTMGLLSCPAKRTQHILSLEVWGWRSCPPTPNAKWVWTRLHRFIDAGVAHPSTCLLLGTLQLGKLGVSKEKRCNILTEPASIGEIWANAAPSSSSSGSSSGSKSLYAK
jgi:hypothetical protein